MWNICLLLGRTAVDVYWGSLFANESKLWLITNIEFVEGWGIAKGIEWKSE